MSLGYCIGSLFELDRERRKQWFVSLGAASLSAVRAAENDERLRRSG
jgi:hypothetical protein